MDRSADGVPVRGFTGAGRGDARDGVRGARLRLVLEGSEARFAGLGPYPAKRPATGIVDEPNRRECGHKRAADDAGSFPSACFQAREAGLFAARSRRSVAPTIITPNFASLGNLLTIGRNASEVGIIALGMTIVLITAHVDLSVGAVYAAGGIAAGLLLAATGSAYVAVAGGIGGVGAIVGLTNGILAGYLGLNSFMVTLATLGIVRGSTVIATGGTTVSISGQGVPDDQLEVFRLLGTKLPSGITGQLVVFLILVVITAWILRSTKPGFLLYAVGGNAEASGIRPGASGCR